MENLRKYNCTNCGGKETVKVNITENEDETSVDIKICTACGHRSSFNELMDL